MMFLTISRNNGVKSQQVSPFLSTSKRTSKEKSIYKKWIFFAKGPGSRCPAWFWRAGGSPGRPISSCPVPRDSIKTARGGNKKRKECLEPLPYIPGAARVWRWAGRWSKPACCSCCSSWSQIQPACHTLYLPDPGERGQGHSTEVIYLGFFLTLGILF